MKFDIGDNIVFNVGSDCTGLGKIIDFRINNSCEQNYKVLISEYHEKFWIGRTYFFGENEMKLTEEGNYILKGR